MALFRKKPPQDEGNGGSKDEDVVFTPNPEKARDLFKHARKAADQTSYDYALNLYASGLKLDPETMSAHDEMLAAAIRYHNNGGKAASGKEIRVIEEPHPIGRFIAAEFTWMKNISNIPLAMKAIEAAVKADQLEWGNSVSDRILSLIRNSKKVNKSMWLNAMHCFTSVHAYSHAMFAGQQALDLDPNDSSLDHELKNISAQRAMVQGGYEDAAGKEGGFREMVKDFDQQKALEEGDRITTSASAEERNLERAKAEYKANPMVPDLINKYAKLLRKRGSPEAIDQAYKLYLRGFEDTNEYRFRMFAGDIEIDRARRAETEIKERLAQSTDNGELKAELDQVHQSRLELEAREFGERIEKYPTDRYIRFRLGEIAFETDDIHKAMECFQSSKDEPKLKVRAGHLLGKCFAKESWHSEAIEEFREAIEVIDVADRDRVLDINYDMMLSLIEHARNEQDSDFARDAKEICSIIARKNISYRDIKDKRNEVEKLIKELRAQKGAPGNGE